VATSSRAVARSARRSPMWARGAGAPVCVGRSSPTRHDSDLLPLRSLA
jgi:hypothetical protein